MSKPINFAAWYVAASQKPLEVGPALYTSPNCHDVVIKNAAIAINPIDYKLQEFPFFPLDFPGLLGLDVAGEVVEVGDEVTKFKVGDRVLGLAGGLFTKTYSQCAFQNYTNTGDDVVARIPDWIVPERHDRPEPPRFKCRSERPSGPHLERRLERRLQCNPTLRSRRLHSLHGSIVPPHLIAAILGASKVFDYNSPSVVKDIATALEGRKLAGVLDCININNSIKLCGAVRDASNNAHTTIATVLEIPEGMPNVTRVFALTLRQNELAKAIYEDFLPWALEQGKFIPAPEPLVVGTGLESVQEGLDMLKKGVSAKKIVVKL